MGKGMKHYKRDGTLFKGNTHKMPNGDLHSVSYLKKLK